MPPGPARGLQSDTTEGTNHTSVAPRERSECSSDARLAVCVMSTSLQIRDNLPIALRLALLCSRQNSQDCKETCHDLCSQEAVADPLGVSFGRAATAGSGGAGVQGCRGVSAQVVTGVVDTGTRDISDTCSRAAFSSDSDLRLTCWASSSLGSVHLRPLSA